jgi:ribonuclease HII
LWYKNKTMLKNYSKETGIQHVAGLDEVGRGCFAGPVVTAAVILPPDFEHELIRDSKKLTENKRKEAYDIIIENAIAYSIQAGSSKLVDSEGINSATFITMHKCLNDLSIKPNHILVDGTQWNDWNSIPYECVIKGDNTYLSIAAASIIAKVKRDDYMVKIHEIHPEYNFANSKGYYCKKHGEGLIKYGTCRYHRKQYIETWSNNRGIILK